MTTSYDVHTHIGVDLGFWMAGWWPYGCTTQQLVGHMNDSGIDRAVCFPTTLSSAFDPYAFAADRKVILLPGRVPYDLENPRLLDEIDRLGYGDRLLPLAMFDPGRGVPAQLERLEPLVGRIAGLKTQATVLESPIRNLLGDARDLMDFARQHDLPVVIHTSILPADTWSQAADCIEVAAANPHVRFNLAHSLRFHAPCLRDAAALPNVWIDCSAHLVHCQIARDNSPSIAAPADRVDADYASPPAVLEAVHAIVGGGYLWGSDAPFMSWCDDVIKAVYEYREEVDALRATPDAIQESMLHAAPVKWLFGDKGEPA